MILALSKVVPKGGSRGGSRFFGHSQIFQSGSRVDFGNQVGNHLENRVSLLECRDISKVVPEVILGTSTGTSKKPQIPKWFPFPYTKYGTEPWNEVFSSTAF
jgi:hypothetical protein